MTSYLVVGNQTLGGRALVELVKEKTTTESAAVHVLVPATDPADEPAAAARESTWAQLEGREGAVEAAEATTGSDTAHRRLHDALERLSAAGVEATGSVGPADPMEAIGEALSAGSYTGLIISTLPAGISRWLHIDLPHRAARNFELPVEWIETRADAPDEATTIRIELPSVARRNLEPPGNV